MTQHYNLTLHNDVQEIPQLAAFIDSIAEENSIDLAVAMNLNLAMEEAVVNVMNYAYPGEIGRLIEIDASLDDSFITFVIKDSGIPFDPTSIASPDITLSADERAIGGLGIHLVRQLMDSMEYLRKDDLNLLTLKKKIKSAK